MKFGRKSNAWLALAILTWAAGNPMASEDRPTHLSEDLANSTGECVEITSIADVWKYHAGDDPSWANSDFDDSDWEMAPTTLTRDSLPTSGWTGIGWYRLHLTVAPSMVGQPIAYRLAQLGAAELYLDGRLIYSAGRVADNSRAEKLYIQAYPEPRMFVLSDTVAVFAVRFSNHQIDYFHHHHKPAGFILELSDSDRRVYSSSRTKLHVRAFQWGFTGACSVLGLIFVLIYLFSHRDRQNLFVALVAFGCAMMSYWPFEMLNGNSLAYEITADLMMKVGIVTAALFGIQFLYELFYIKLPKQYWFFLTSGLLYLALGWVLPIAVGYVYYIVLVLEMVRVVVVAVMNRRCGSATIALGFALFAVGGIYQSFLEYDLLPQPVEGVFLPYLAGILGLLIAMAFHLARQFALTNAELAEQLAQVSVLSEKAIQQEVNRKLLQKDIEHKEKQLREASRLEQALSELETAHAKLQEADTRTRKIIDASPVPLIVSRIDDGTILYANRHLGRLVDYPVEELEGRLTPDFYVDPSDRSLVVEKLKRDGFIENHEFRLKRRDGDTIWCLFSVAISRLGEDEVIIGGLYDISERKEAEEKLKLYGRIFENSRDGIMVFDTEGRLILRNPAHRHLSGLSDSEVEGKTVADLVPQAAREPIRKRLAEGHAYRGEHEWPPIDGQELPIDLSVFTIPDADGNVIYSVGMGRDISERRAAGRAMQQTLEKLQAANDELKEAQTQLVQSEKMASLGMLVAGIAHEINTPVGAISSMHNTLLRAIDKLKNLLYSCDISGEEKSSLKPIMEAIDDANRVIDSGTERVTTIVRRLRSFARLDEAELKAVDIHEGIEDTLTLIQHEIKNRITVVREFSDLPPVTCYPGRINQVFLNLLNNARQAIVGQGTITIETALVGGLVEIKFSDSGSGIDPTVIKKIFDPGFTTKGVRVGTGLGLSICYQIIQDHRGKITVESGPDQGTTFTIRLPLDLEEQLERERGV